MNIPLEYQVFIGSALAGLFLGLIRWIKDYRRNKDDEPQRLAFVSIIMGVLIIIPFISIIGLLLAIISFTIKKNKRLSKVAIVVNILGTLPWIAVMIFGS